MSRGFPACGQAARKPSGLDLGDDEPGEHSLPVRGSVRHADSAGVPAYVPENRKIHGVRVAGLVAGFPSPARVNRGDACDRAAGRDVVGPSRRSLFPPSTPQVNPGP